MSDTAHEYGKNRFWEIVPGALVWLTFILAFVFSFIAPVYVVVFIIVFDLYWLFRVLYFIIFLLYAWRNYKKTVRVNWLEKIKTLDKANDIYHLVFLPTYKEGMDVIKPTFESLRGSDYPNGKMIIAFGGEEKDKENFLKHAQEIQKEYTGVFKKIIIIVHPSGLPGEIPGKGSNLNWMGQKVAKILETEFPEIADENIVVSSFDIDTIAHPQYFAYLTYLYCTVKDPTRSSYQPVALFANNIWTAQAPVRISAFGTTFWLLGELSRPERLWTFSSHSMPWKMLKDVGFWQRDIVSEDSRIFLQGFLHYHGDYRVTPMFMPVSLDTVTGDNYFQAMKALYKQQRRWAWGVEHLPVMVEHFKNDPQISFRKKAKYLFNHIEGMYTWATAPLLIFVLGWLPLWAASDPEALVQAAPFTLEQIMRVATIGVFVSGILSLTLLPPRPKTTRWTTWFIMIIQWALLPITFIVFGAFPAIDAQTRLMIGKYLGFNVTKKSRVKSLGDL
ncbi:MAG: hypothetical protein ABIH21_02480 [Patescibacteria group bacterium]